MAKNRESFRRKKINKRNHTGRIIAETNSDKIEETIAQMKRRTMKSLKEEAGGRRRIKVGAYKIATYNEAIAIQAIAATGFETTACSSIAEASTNPRDRDGGRDANWILAYKNCDIVEFTCEGWFGFGIIVPEGCRVGLCLSALGSALTWHSSKAHHKSLDTIAPDYSPMTCCFTS